MKTTEYKGHRITIEKVIGFHALIEDIKTGEIVTGDDESIGLSDTKKDALEVGKEFIDALEELAK